MRLATGLGDLWGWFSYAEKTVSVLEKLKECGFHHVDMNFACWDYETSPFWKEDWKQWVSEIKKTMNGMGMDFVQAHSTSVTYQKGEKRDWQMKSVKRQIEACALLGISGTVVHCVCEAGITKEDFVKENIEFYKELLETAEKYGVEVYTENSVMSNPPAYYLVDADGFYELYDALGQHPLFGCCWDIGHAHMQGVCQYDEMLKLGEHLKVVHIHDNNGREDSHRFPYMGTISMDEIMHALQDINFSQCFVMEISSGIRFPGTKRKDFEGDGRLLNPPLEYGMKVEEALYMCGKHILNQYNCFEE